MLPLTQRVAFVLFAALCLIFSGRGFYRLYRRIASGRVDADARWNRLPQRLWYAAKTTLTQQRVFRKRLTLSIFHAFIFYAFVLYLLVNLLDAIDGFHPLLASPSLFVERVYGALSDIFSVLAIIGVLALLLRRLALRSRRDFRFPNQTLLAPAIRNGYIRRDSIIVAAFILFHIGSRVLGNAARLAVEGPQPAQPLSTLLSHALAGPHDLAWRIFGYWGALGSVLLFLVYFPYTKHVHILMAPMKYLVRRDAGTGTLPPASLDLGSAEPQIGAAQLADLSWPRLLDAYACIQCNRCQDVCPASQTGKALSPAALEINKRMLLNGITTEVSAFSLTELTAFETGTSSGPALLQAVLSPEAAWACTTCGACMQICPTQDEQMLDIIDIRRNAVLLQGSFPPQLQSAFRGMERQSNPWALAREKRTEWAAGLNVPTVDDVPDPDVLYWVGCAASYDPGAQRSARATVQLLQAAGVKFAVLGNRECCTGDSARRAGNELLYQELATTAIQTLRRVNAKTVVASCPHCVNTIGSEYPQLGGHFDVRHHTEYLAELLAEGRLTPVAAQARITFHDPCYLGRHRGVYEQPRSVLKVLSNDYVDLPRTKSNAFCCGAGGAQFWKEEEPGTERVSSNRMREAREALAPARGDKVLAVGCPFCKSMLQSAPEEADGSHIDIKDVAELLWEGVQRARPADLSPAPDSLAITPATVAVSAAKSTFARATSTVTSSRREASPIAAPSEPPLKDPALHGSEPDSSVALPARKKWTPKTGGASPEHGLDGNAAGNETASEAEPRVPRKKWQPGGPR